MSRRDPSDKSNFVPTSSHWGNYRVEVRDQKIAGIHTYPEDTHPTAIRHSLLDALDPNCRIAQPMIREGYLNLGESSDGSRRGREKFLPVSWDEALDIASGALDRVRSKFGNESIYGGSYGWSSAGRFHHAQSQVHRFLNTIGGYTYSVNTYSTAAAEVITPHVLGLSFFDLMMQAPTVEDLVEHTRLVVCFGGIAMKNTQVMAGGLGAHTAHDQVELMRAAGLDFVNISPIRDDMNDTLQADWWPCRPNSDVAIMMGLAHTLVVEQLHDENFLNRYCEGYGRFEKYLLGHADGQPKDAEWAAELSEISAQRIRDLAQRMARERTLIGISWSLQRARHGEQTYWMASTLAAMLGTHGLPGSGVAYGYGSAHNIGFGGRRLPPYRVGSLPQGRNAIDTFIPVARAADMLLNPGETIDYNGQQITYPEIRLIYWAGGNPFHHHQDLNRLRRAWSQPETIIVNEPFWTAAARHADIVFPCNTPLERNDLGGSSLDHYLTPMRQAVPSFGESKSDYEVFSALAARLGVDEAFTEGRSEMQWIKRLYETTRENAAREHVELPNFEAFWSGEQFSVREQIADRTYTLEAFRTDPKANALKTPSGKIEIFSATVASFDYDDCPGHPTWLDKREWLGASRTTQFPLHLLSNQPKTRLHSQYDHGVTSRKEKIKEREVIRMHPNDASSRSIKDGDIVRVFNDRGACLAAAATTEGLRVGVVELPTGAWYDPEDPLDDDPLEIHGNPNTLTEDVGTSKLAQGPSAHSCLVQIERYDEQLPAIKAFRQPQ